MKVKAVKIEVLSAFYYLTEDKVYDVLYSFTRKSGDLALDIVDDLGEVITVLVSDKSSCAHGVKWEIVA